MPTPDSRWYLPMHNAGMEMLKQKMWQNLGVDYTPGYQHMDDTQTPDDQARAYHGGNWGYHGLKANEKQMEKELNLPQPEQSVQPQPKMIMANALQGPQNPAMQALFSQPAPHLQQMAGDVISPNPAQFGANIYTDKYWDRVSQPGGYAPLNPPAGYNDAVARGMMHGAIGIVPWQGK